ncbi:leucine-rich repeat flightless-interacting protein 1 isoform X5 [Ranitomeya imitator]|uniref:leucine-rich repeat flightless-interacting protein 1 isoform X5 n=1 Tax=Ranitomeya imitator TaxID=111125 RepID=UPI0037E75A99
MGTQGPGRKRHPNREILSAEDNALNQIAREAEARLAAKRAARAEAREIRMKELERQQKEIYQVQKKYYGLDTKWGDIEQWMEDSERYSHRPRRNLQASDEDDVVSVTSRSSLRSAYYSDLSLANAPLTAKSQQQSVHNGNRPSLLNCNSLPSRSQRGSLYDDGVTSSSRRSSSSRPVEERSDKDFAEKGGRPVSALSAATLASLGGTSSRRGSGDTSLSVDTEASIREIKDSLAEVEEKYKRSMVTNAQLDNEKTSLQYQVDTLREVLLEMEEEVAESRRQYEDKQKECERQKHEQGVLRFQLSEMKEALEQREALMTEIRQLQQKQEIGDREICDLKETIEWKDKKIGALERQKEFFDPVRSERDALRDEVTQLRDTLKKHGIVLDSDGTLNGDSSIENHVNFDGPPDPPIRAVSMGNTEETVEKKETTSVVGEGPPSQVEQDRVEVTQDAQKEIQLHPKGGDVTHENNEKENNSNTVVEMEPFDVFSRHKSETNVDEQKEETSYDTREDLQKMSLTEVLENFSAVDGDTTSKQSDISPSGSDVFQDAIDFVDDHPITVSAFYEDDSGSLSDCEKEEPKNSQEEDIPKADDHVPMGGAAETTNEPVNICKSAESSDLEDKQDHKKTSINLEDLSTELSENITSDKNVHLEHEVILEQKTEPQLSPPEESGSQILVDQNQNTEILSAPEKSEVIDQSEIISTHEQPSQDTLLPITDLVAQVESENDKTLDVSESCAVSKSNSVTEEESRTDCVIPGDSGDQNIPKPIPEEERQDVSLERQDLKVADQREDDLLPHDPDCENIQNADDTLSNTAESPKEIVPPEVFSSEGESTQEGEETGDDDEKDDTVKSEKYTGESEIPCASLGSSVDRQSLEDIRMEGDSDKSPRRGKGKNKDDCVVS